MIDEREVPPSFAARVDTVGQLTFQGFVGWVDSEGAGSVLCSLSNLGGMAAELAGLEESGNALGVAFVVDYFLCLLSPNCDIVTAIQYASWLWPLICGIHGASSRDERCLPSRADVGVGGQLWQSLWR